MSKKKIGVGLAILLLPVIIFLNGGVLFYAELRGWAPDRAHAHTYGRVMIVLQDTVNDNANAVWVKPLDWVNGWYCEYIYWWASQTHDELIPRAATVWYAGKL